MLLTFFTFLKISDVRSYVECLVLFDNYQTLKYRVRQTNLSNYREVYFLDYKRTLSENAENYGRFNNFHLLFNKL